MSDTYQPARAPLTAAQVAAELGHDVEWFYANRPELETAHGFPKPLPGCGNRWDLPAINAWKDSQLPREAGVVVPFAPEGGLRGRAKKLAGKA